MKSEPSIAARSLRAVALAITLVAIVTVSTVAYSAYQEYSLIKGGHTGLSFSAVQTGSKTVLTLNGSVPNRGLYPVEFDVSYDATLGSAVLAAASFQPVTVAAGASQTVSEEAVLDLFSSRSTAGLAELIVNGSTLGLQYNVTARLEPFAGIAVVTNSTERFAPLLGNLSLGAGTQSTMGGRNQLMVAVSFFDSNSFGGTFPVYMTVMSGGSMLANTTVTTAAATPGQRTLLQLTATTSAPLAVGTYQAVLHVVVEGTDVPIPVEVRVA